MERKSAVRERSSVSLTAVLVYLGISSIYREETGSEAHRRERMEFQDI